MSRARLALGSIAWLLAACAPETAPSNVQVHDAWARATAPGQTSAAAYLQVLNPGREADRLLAARSPAARSVALHSSANSGGIARMRPLPEGLEIPPEGQQRLAPGGAHLMLTGLAAPLTAGSTVELSLRFERAGERSVALRVLDASAAAPSHDRHGGQ